ncbi:aminoglycoside phosphotransferase family protein [Oscillospiraceae bacterium HV4-5-C5C]|nr:aminoglycoside phosphotransferase family protein [Oscillospiraceae bacterium HV4-5-C5C]
MRRFNAEINHWADWGRVFQSVSQFTPLIRQIYQNENLPFTKLENLQPGTNAVFKVGYSVCKVFAPPESGLDSLADFHTEWFGLTRAHALGLPVPKVIARGRIRDRYDFMYLILELIEAKSYASLSRSLSDADKTSIGWQLRQIADRMDTPCEPFNQWDPLVDGLENPCWQQLPDSFNRERLAYLSHLQCKQRVYVHGDINPDNVLLDQALQVYLIDFADAILAPPEYELAALCDLFDYDAAAMSGYFGSDYRPEVITEHFFQAVLLHHFGANIILNKLGTADDFTSLNKLKNRIFEVLQEGKVHLNGS